MKKILLIMLGLSALLFADFFRSGGVVTDYTTSLQWQDDYKDNGGNIKHTTWRDAIDYCETLNFGGHEDWRLPNKKELLSIVDYVRYSLTISSIFQNTSHGGYWSSTTDAISSSSAWLVSFYNGITDSYDKATTEAVRCVRLIQ